MSAELESNFRGGENDYILVKDCEDSSFMIGPRKCIYGWFDFTLNDDEKEDTQKWTMMKPFRPCLGGIRHTADLTFMITIVK